MVSGKRASNLTWQLVQTALQHLTEPGRIEKFGVGAHTRYGLKGESSEVVRSHGTKEVVRNDYARE